MVALFGIGIGITLVELFSHVVATPSFTPQLAAMIGIGVGIDYALFIVTRYRQGSARRARTRACRRARDRHERSGGALRRRHGRDLAPRTVPDRRVVHPRARGRRVARRRCSSWRPRSRCCPRCSASSGTRSTSSRCRQLKENDAEQQLLGPVEPHRPAPPVAVAFGVAGRPDHPRDAVLLDAPRLPRRRQRPDLVHDSSGLRPDRPKASGPGLNGPLPLAAEFRRPGDATATLDELVAAARERPGRRERAARPTASPNGEARAHSQVVAEGIAAVREQTAPRAPPPRHT